MICDMVSEQRIVTNFLFKHMNSLKIIHKKEIFLMKAQVIYKMFLKKSKNMQNQGVYF